MTFLAAYPAYRPTWVPGLNKLPLNWQVTRVKHVTRFQVGWTPPTKDDSNFDGDNLWANISDLGSKVICGTSKRVSDDAVKAASINITPRGALLYSFKLSVGLVSFAGADMYTNEAIASFLSSPNLPLSYLYYALPAFVIQNASTNIYGARILNQDLIKNAVLVAPSYEEATQIAKFLDYETAKIDALIDKQEQLIALLKEKRQAVISHAVTKGLNPDAPMRDSGIEWLGKIPAHWEIMKGGWLGRVFGSEPVSEDNVLDDGPLLFIKVSSLAIDGFELSERRFFVSSKVASMVSPRTGFIVFPKRGAAIFTNKVNIVTEPAIIDPNLMGWLMNGRAIPEYLAHLIKLRGLGDIADVSTVPQINNKHIAPMMLPVPPVREQEAIVEVLQKRLQHLDLLICKSEDQIHLLQERRAALISAAVTGKIDVRNWQAPQEVEVAAEVA